MPSSPEIQPRGYLDVADEAAVSQGRLRVFFDGACPLCRGQMAAYVKRDRAGRLEPVDISAAGFDAAKYGLDGRAVNKVMHAQLPDGHVVTQVAAFCEIWRVLPRRFWTGAAIVVLRIPGMLPLANIFYRAFARNRYRLTGRCADGACKI